MDALLVTGARASHLHTVYTTHKSMNKRKTTLLVVDNVSDVMAEAVCIFIFFLYNFNLLSLKNYKNVKLSVQLTYMLA